MAVESQAPAPEAASKAVCLEGKQPEPMAVGDEKAVDEPEGPLKTEGVEGGHGNVEPTERPVDPEKKALDELKQLLAAAIANKEFSKPPPVDGNNSEETKKPEGEKPEVPEKLEEGGKSGEPKKIEAGEKRQEEEHRKSEEGAMLEQPIDPEEPKKEVEEPEKLQKVEEEAKQGEPTMLEEPKKVEEFVMPEECKKEEPTWKDSTMESLEERPGGISLWGISLLEEGERSDTVLLKFLRARDLKAKDALAMIKDTVAWRKSFGIDGLLEEDLGARAPELQKAVFMHGVDRNRHPVCYNVYGELEDKEVFLRAFGDEEKRRNFLRWRVQLLEKGIKELLDFGAGDVSSMVQVNDLKGAPWLWRKEVRVATKDALHVLQDNYPEFVANQVFINVPWWYLAFNRMMSPFLTQRTKSKFIFAGPSKSAEILFKYIAPEQVPVQFGGLSKDDDPDFCNSDAASEVAIKPSSEQTIVIPVSEPCLLVWELRVLGWDVSYKAEFVPDAEDRYTIIVQKNRKLAPSDDPIEKNSYKIGEPGKIVLTIDNSTSKKKRLLYRYKTKISLDSI